MTNAKKYLKDGVSVEELVKELCLKFYEKRVANYAQDKITIQEVLTNYFNEEVTPTLTEDERVILKNFKESYKYIGREGMLYIARQKKDSEVVTQVVIDEYKPSLFQFIKEGEEYEIEKLLGDEK